MSKYKEKACTLMWFWMYKIENQLKFEDLIFPYGKLNENNRWIKLSKIIPWMKSK